MIFSSASWDDLVGIAIHGKLEQCVQFHGYFFLVSFSISRKKWIEWIETFGGKADKRGFRDAPFDIQWGVRKFKKKKFTLEAGKKKKNSPTKWARKKKNHPPSGKKSTLGVYRRRKNSPPKA